MYTHINLVFLLSMPLNINFNLFVNKFLFVFLDYFCQIIRDLSHFRILIFFNILNNMSISMLHLYFYNHINSHPYEMLRAKSIFPVLNHLHRANIALDAPSPSSGLNCCYIYISYSMPYKMEFCFFQYLCACPYFNY